MKRALATAVGLGLGVVVALGLLAAVGRTAEPRFPHGAPVGPVMRPDTGAGEMLLLVVGGTYPTQADAEAANAQMPFADLAGYYVVPVDQFLGFRELIGDVGDYALVSAFRTEQGAQDFAAFAQSFGYPATILPQRVQSLGGVYAGLGQEPNAAGTGPLTHPIAASLP